MLFSLPSHLALKVRATEIFVDLLYEEINEKCICKWCVSACVMEILYNWLNS